MIEVFDVLVVGAGVVGSAVARELSRYRLKVGVLEKELDVCCGTSGRNSGVLHAGFNNKPGSKMARLCVEGNRGFDQVAGELDVRFKRTGKLVVGFSPEDREQLIQMKATGDRNGVPGLEIVGKDRIQELAPSVRGEFAMWSPSTAILDPFEYFLLDQKAGPLLPLPAYPVPNPKEGGLGIHLTPTVDGNIMVGPSTEYVDRDDDYSATQKTMDLLIADGSKIFPHLQREYFIRNFSGIRPKLASKEEGGFRDFVIERREGAPHAVNLVGIESPGLTSAVPIAKEVICLMEEVETLKTNPDFNPIRRRITSFRDKTPEEQAELIRENSDYGEIICRCETVTKAEVLAAIRNPLGVDTVTGVKYRCRAMMGRCQGGYCQTRVTELIMQEKKKAREDLLYNRKGSKVFTGTVRA